jgi:uncharacterized membrane protein
MINLIIDLIKRKPLPVITLIILIGITIWQISLPTKQRLEYECRWQSEAQSCIALELMNK